MSSYNRKIQVVAPGCFCYLFLFSFLRLPLSSKRSRTKFVQSIKKKKKKPTLNSYRWRGVLFIDYERYPKEHSAHCAFTMRRRHRHGVRFFLVKRKSTFLVLKTKNSSGRRRRHAFLDSESMTVSTLPKGNIKLERVPWAPLYSSRRAVARIRVNFYSVQRGSPLRDLNVLRLKLRRKCILQCSGITRKGTI